MDMEVVVAYLRTCAAIYVECERKQLASSLRYEPITSGVRHATHSTAAFS